MYYILVKINVSWWFYMNYVVVFAAARLKAKALEIEHYAKLEADNMVLNIISF